MAAKPDTSPPPFLPLRSKLLYTVGYFGVSLLSGLFLLWANYRYGMLFTRGGKAYVGIALLIAHLIDAPLDPLVGWWSDRTRSRLGRRKPFILWGTGPLIVAFALLWAPPGGRDSLWNATWLLGVGAAFLGLFSLVVNPYLAMLPDLARSSEDRVSTSAYLAAFGLGAEVLAMVGGSLLASRLGFLTAVGIVSAVALLCLLCPLLVPEPSRGVVPGNADRWSARRGEPVAQGSSLRNLAATPESPTCHVTRTSGPRSQQPPEALGLLRSLRLTLANRPFRLFLASKCLYWFGVRAMIAMVPFFVAGVLGVSEGQVERQSALFIAWAILPAFAWFAALKPLARRYSKRRLALAGLACLAVGAGLMVTVGVVPLDRVLYARAITVLCSFAIAAVFAMPNAILADLVDLDALLTGSRREAMYFGAQGFFVKLSWGGASALIMGLQGAFHANPAIAARLAWFAVCLTSALAFAIFRRFPEDRDLATSGGG